VRALTSTQSGRNSSRGLIAGAILTLTLSAPTGAFAQINTPPANTQVIAPKQVGSWTVIGWSQGYCAGERPLPGAAGGGATLQFVSLPAFRPAIVWPSAPRSGS
jgi:hypothetical protein